MLKYKRSRKLKVCYSLGDCRLTKVRFRWVCSAYILLLDRKRSVVTQDSYLESHVHLKSRAKRTERHIFLLSVTIFKWVPQSIRLSGNFEPSRETCQRRFFTHHRWPQSRPLYYCACSTDQRNITGSKLQLRDYFNMKVSQRFSSSSKSSRSSIWTKGNERCGNRNVKNHWTLLWALLNNSWTMYACIPRSNRNR